MTPEIIQNRRELVKGWLSRTLLNAGSNGISVMNPRPKPGHMLPCNGCGLCCQEEVCFIGQEVFGDIDAPCPLLVKRKGLYRCGMVLIEASMPIEKMLASSLGIGMGCCADDVEKINP